MHTEGVLAEAAHALSGSTYNFVLQVKWSIYYSHGDRAVCDKTYCRRARW